LARRECRPRQDPRQGRYTINADGTALTQVTLGGSDNFPDGDAHPLARVKDPM